MQLFPVIATGLHRGVVRRLADSGDLRDLFPVIATGLHRGEVDDIDLAQAVDGSSRSSRPGSIAATSPTGATWRGRSLFPVIATGLHRGPYYPTPAGR